eukprot:4470-Heterococcus_DN1.PRE.4
MKVAAATVLAAIGAAQAFMPAAPLASSVTFQRATTTTRMALNAELTKTFPRDFTKEDEANRIAYLENALQATLKKVIETKKRPIFTTALIAGDSVILDAIAKAGLLDKIDVIFIDTFFLFPESVAFIKELEDHYGFKAK